MGLFSFLFKKKPEIAIQHPLFGQMTYVYNKLNKSSNYFRCEKYFRPASTKITLNIAADVNGPTETQTNYFRSIEHHYTSMLPDIASRITTATSSTGKKEPFFFDDFSKDFRLLAIYIATSNKTPIECMITFLTDPAPNYDLVVELEDMELIGVELME